MTICLFSEFPSGQQGLSERGEYIAPELQQAPLLDPTMRMGEIDFSRPDLPAHPEQSFSSAAVPSCSIIFGAAAPRWVPWM